jgi:hypothetical protein
MTAKHLSVVATACSPKSIAVPKIHFSGPKNRDASANTTVPPIPCPAIRIHVKETTTTAYPIPARQTVPNIFNAIWATSTTIRTFNINRQQVYNAIVAAHSNRVRDVSVAISVPITHAPVKDCS